MACMMSPDKKMIRDHRYPNTRTKIGKEMCNKCRCDWGMAVSFLQIPLVEEKYNCTIYVFDKYNIPMLGLTISLLMSNCVMYKSQNKNKNQYFLLYDEIKQHYDCIIDIKKFMGVRELCYHCLKGFTH